MITDFCCSPLFKNVFEKLSCTNTLNFKRSTIFGKIGQAITEVKGLKYIAFPNEITFHKTALVKLKTVNEIFQNSNLLEHVDLSDQYNLAGKAVSALLQIRADSLKTLVLRDIELTDSAFQDIENCSKLCVLKIYCKKLTDATLERIKNLCLSELELLVGINFTAEGLRKYFEEGLVSQIKQLNFSYCFTLEDNCLSTLANRCPELVSLSVAECRKLTDNAISQVVEKCSNLVILNLKGLIKLDGTFLENIKHPLKVLNLTSCTGIKESSIKNFCKIHNFSLKTEAQLPELEIETIINRIFEPILFFTPS